MKLGLILFLFMFCNVRGQIIRGQKATPAQFPYVVQVHTREPTIEPDFVHHEFVNPTETRTGVIIGEKFVLTAAHIVRKRRSRTGHWIDSRGVWVVGGNLHLDDQQSFKYKIIEAENIDVHDWYNGNPETYDIALLHLTEPLPLDDESYGMSSINIGSNNPAIGTDCTVMGWGKTHMRWNGEWEYSVSTNYLLWGPTTVCNKCKRYYSRQQDKFICADGSQPGYTLTARGDSGGPLVCTDIETNRDMVYGTLIGG